MPFLVKQNVPYTDFSLTFLQNPNTGDIGKLTGEAAVNNSIRNLLLTQPGEKPFKYLLASRLSEFLFEQNSSLLSTAITNEIANVITANEPRIEIRDIVITTSENLEGYVVSIYYSMRNDLNNTQYEINIPVERST